MHLNKRWFVTPAALLLTACGQAASAPSSSPSNPAPADPSPSAQAAGPSGAPAPTADLAPFERIELSDVRTGEHFNLGGFQGKQVIVEGMATW